MKNHRVRFECLEARMLLAADLRINEFMAKNGATMLDGFDNAPDWVELYNAGTEPIDLQSFRLTDNPELPAKWSFPLSQIIEPDEYLIVFASGRDERDPKGYWHTNFKLSSNGEYLGFSNPEGVILSQFGSATSDYPNQRHDVSYGLGDNMRFNATDIPLEISANRVSTIHSHLSVSDRPGSIEDIRVEIDISHRWVDDLDAFLVSPTGTRVELFSDVGGSGDNFTNTRLSDDGSLRIDAGSAPFTGVFQPEESLATFAGENANGKWTLEIHDDFSAVGGTLNQWSLILETTKDNGHRAGYMSDPTPGSGNLRAFRGFAKNPSVDQKRGFFDQPFDVTAMNSDPEEIVLYTLDGSTPTPDNSAAQIYEAPITINTTKTLRLRAFGEGLIPSETLTHSYLFIDDVLQQPHRPSGFPARWAGRTTIAADYEMDPAITNHADYSQDLPIALRALPTVSLAMDVNDWFDAEIGIYSNSEEKGALWERPVSAEFLGYPDADDLQIDAGIRLQGNASRWPSRPKHNMRLAFRSEYGAGRLEYPLFGQETVTRFNSIVLRGGNGDSWINPNVFHRGSYIRDQWHRDIQSTMGHVTSLQGYAHLYINGLYWGLYHLFERVDADFMSEHFGGSEDDYDVIKDIRNTGGLVEAVSGTTESWLELVSRVSTDLSTNENYAAALEYVDVVNLIDYLLINFYSGNRDWDRSNWRAGRHRESGRFVFFAWDSERTDLNTSSTVTDGPVSRNVTRTNNPKYPTFFHQQFTASPEYRMLFADRTQRHLFQNGTLTPTGAAERWNARANEIRDAIVAESARWGDAHSVSPRTPATWESHNEDMNTKWFPDRTSILLRQLRQQDLYPNVDAPTFNNMGGEIPQNFQLEIAAAPEGEIYLTTNGADPRSPGGMINDLGTTTYRYEGPINLSHSTTVKARFLTDGVWSALVEANFIVALTGDINSDGKLDPVDVDLVCRGIRQDDSRMDLNNDGQIDESDISFLVEDLMATKIGDVNFDGIFDSSDLVSIFQQGQYEDGFDSNSSWSSGDWNCDGEFDTSDLVTAFRAGGFTANAIGLVRIHS